MLMPAGETEKDPSGWTTDTLQVHLQRQIDDMRRLLDERYATQTKALDAAFSAAEKAVNTALLSAEKAVTKAEDAANARFESVNEFRAQLADQAATFMPRLEAEQRVAQVADRQAALDAREASNFALTSSRLDLTAGRGSGIAQGWQVVVGGAGIVSGIVAVIIAITK